MYLAFDTETTGLPRPHLELTHPAQPHLLQFAGIVFDDEGNELERLFTLVKPGTGAIMSTAAFVAHGITLEEAFHRGMEPAEVFNWFSTRAAKVDRIVGHNVQFDIHIMTMLAARELGQDWVAPCDLFCTMTHATPLLNLPPTQKMIAAGRYHAKAPTLAECVNYFFEEELIGAHNAAADVRACIRVFRHIKPEHATPYYSGPDRSIAG